MSEKDTNPKRSSRKRTSPGRSKAFHYGDFDSDTEADSALAAAIAQSQQQSTSELDFQTSLETSTLGASTAKHEHVVLPPSPTPEDDSKTQDIIDVLVSNDLLYEITVKGMQHLQLSKSSYLEEICTARRKKNQLFQKLEELRDERQKLEELLSLEQSET